MRYGKPIIGITGGIGAGKSFVADLFGELGCCVIKSDDQVREAYEDPAIIETLRQWWGDDVLGPDGRVDRRFIAQKVFRDDEQRRRLERLLHPVVARERDRRMQRVANDPQVPAFVWDTPLLFETGLDRQCDAVVFVDAPLKVRQQRVTASRNWDPQELERRENLQWPLDRKRQISDHTIRNTADAAIIRSQVREVLSRILLKVTDRASPQGPT